MCYAIFEAQTPGTFNQTKVELKLRAKERFGRCSCLLIRPKWNWNSRKWDNSILLQSFNQTKVELKCRVGSLSKAEGCLLIRPKWNWNKRHGPNANRKSRLLIRPKWNWNSASAAANTSSMSLLIRPKWNWNRKFARCKFARCRLLIRPKWNWNFLSGSFSSIPFTFNQTKVELKYSRILRQKRGICLLIRPKWNWNTGKQWNTALTQQLLIRPKWNWNIVFYYSIIFWANF